LRQLRPPRERPRDSNAVLEEYEIGDYHYDKNARRPKKSADGGSIYVPSYEPRPEPAYRNYWQARYCMELIADTLEKLEYDAGGRLRYYRAFKRLDRDNDNYISLSDLENAFRQFKISATKSDIHAVFTELDVGDKGAVDIGQFTRSFKTFQGSFLDRMQMPIQSVYYDGGVVTTGPVTRKNEAEEKLYSNQDPTVAEIRREKQGIQKNEGDREYEGEIMVPSPTKSDPGPSFSSRENDVVHGEPPDDEQDGQHQSQRSQPASDLRETLRESQRAQYDDDYQSSAGLSSNRAGNMQFKTFRGGTQKRFYGTISEVIKSRTDKFKPKKSELYTKLPPGRFSRTIYPDTHYVTQPIPHHTVASYMDEESRFKTMNLSQTIYSAPDPDIPAQHDRLKNMAIRDFRVKRLQNRLADMQTRREIAEEAGRAFEEKRICRKALTLLNYERKIRATQ